MGFTLLEALMAMLLMSLILFNFDAGLLVALKEIHKIDLYNSANQQLNNALERLKSLSANEGFDQQLAQWNCENAIVLPHGFGTIEGRYPNYEITVYWGNNQTECTKPKLELSGCIKQEVQLV